MRKYITTLWQNMDQQRSVRISISYYSLTRMKSPRILDALLIHVGALVISIGLRRVGTLSHTLRDMLTHFQVFPIIFEKMLQSDLAVDFQLDAETSSLIQRNLELCKETSLHTLMERTLSIMENFARCIPGGRVSIPSFSASLPAMVCLGMNYILLYSRYETSLDAQPSEESAPQLQ